MLMHAPIVVAICGSFRDKSYTRVALGHALAAASDAGAKTELIDLREWELPLFDPDDRKRGDAAKLKQVVGDADAVLMGTPVYHGMVSSALKSAFDYLGKDEFEDTTVGLLATAGGGSYGPTLEHLRTGVRTVHGWTLPHEVGIRGRLRSSKTASSSTLTSKHGSPNSVGWPRSTRESSHARCKAHNSLTSRRPTASNGRNQPDVESPDDPYEPANPAGTKSGQIPDAFQLPWADGAGP